jgi:WD40 repeat protein
MRAILALGIRVGVGAVALLLAILVGFGVGLASAEEPVKELKERARLEGEGAVVALAFSADGKTLACLGKGRIGLYNPETGKSIGTVEIPIVETFYSAIALSGDGKTLAWAAGKTGNLRVWNTADGKELLSAKDEKLTFRSVALSPDGKLVATGSNKARAEIREVATGKVTDHFYASDQGPGVANKEVVQLAFSPDGKLLAAGTYWWPGSSYYFTSIAIFDVAKGSPLQFPAEGEDRKECLRCACWGRPTSLLFSPDGKTLAVEADGETVGEMGGGVCLVDIKKGESGEAVRPESWKPSSLEKSGLLAFAPRGLLLIHTGDEDKTFARIWDPKTGEELARTKKGSALLMAAVSPDGKTLATSAADDKAVRLWDLSALADKKAENLKLEPIGKPLDLNEGAKDNGRQLQVLVFSPDGKQLVAGTGDGHSYGEGAVLQWDAESGKHLRTFKIRNEGNLIGRVDALAFSPDGKTIAAVTYYHLLDYCNYFVLLDAVKGDELGKPTDFGNGCCKAVFSPDGKTFLTVGDCKTGLWDNVSGKEKPDFALKNKAQGQNAIFSPDGSKILIGDDREAFTCQLWDVKKGEALGKPMADQGHALTFSPDGKYFVTGGPSGLSVWEATSGKMVSTLKTSWASAVRISPDNKVLLVASGGRIELWDIADAKRLVQIPAAGRTVVDISPDCTKVATGELGGETVRLWKLPDEIAKRFCQNADK